MILRILICILPLTGWGVSLQAAEARNRVEELFIWKISDELKLSVPEEKSFSSLIRELNSRRSNLNDQLQKNLKKMSLPGSTKEKEKILNVQRKLIKIYNDLSIEELDKIQKLFGSQRTAEYLVMKNDLTSKVKNLLASPEKQPLEDKLPPPQVIEEK